MKLSDYLKNLRKMRKRYSLIPLLIVSVFLVNIICCCFAQQAEAKTEVPSCHQQTSNEEQPKNDECECKEIQSLAAQHSSDVLKPRLSIINTLDTSLIISYHRLGREDPQLQLSASSIEFSDSSSPPVYIQHSNLRL